MAHHLRNLTVLLCIAPSAIMNIWPRIGAALQGGTLDASAAGVVVLQAAAVATMAAVPLGVSKGKTTVLKLACLALGIALFSLNLFNAIEVASHVRESVTSGTSTALVRAAALKSRIEKLRKSRSELPQQLPPQVPPQVPQGAGVQVPLQVPPQVPYTSPAMVSAAKDAMKSAETARDAECRWAAKASPKCDQREAEFKAALAEFSRLTAQLELTERADKLDREIESAEREMENLGPLPKHVDAAAARIASLLNVSEEWVHENWPTWLAIVVELLALFGPVTWVEAMAEPRLPPMPQPKLSKGGRPKAATTAAPAPKTRKSTKSKPVGSGDIQTWFSEQTLKKDGHGIRVSEAYDAYVQWCTGRSENPVSLTVFGTTMKKDLAVDYAEKSKRGFYIGIALKNSALKVVSV
jgi:hypothetical protein